MPFCGASLATVSSRRPCPRQADSVAEARGAGSVGVRGGAGMTAISTCVAPRREARSARSGLTARTRSARAATSRSRRSPTARARRPPTVRL